MAKTSELESEMEFESEWELPPQHEGEGEGEAFGEHELFSSNGHGTPALRSGASEFEFESESEGEQFFGSFKKFFKKAAPFLKKALKVAAPILGTAVGGPAGTLIGGAASALLREAEGEGELEGESEWEGELEGTYESRRSYGTPRQNWMPDDFAAEAMSAWASKSESEAEAEAYIGAASAISLSRSDDAKIRALIPQLVNASAVLSQILRKHPATRPVMRTLPEVARMTHRDLSRMVLSGRPVNRKTAARAFYRQASQMFTDPRLCGNTLYRNIRAQRNFARAI